MGDSVPSRENSKVKGPEVEVCLAWHGNTKVKTPDNAFTFTGSTVWWWSQIVIKYLPNRCPVLKGPVPREKHKWGWRIL